MLPPLTITQTASVSGSATTHHLTRALPPRHHRHHHQPRSHCPQPSLSTRSPPLPQLHEVGAQLLIAQEDGSGVMVHGTVLLPWSCLVRVALYGRCLVRQVSAICLQLWRSGGDILCTSHMPRQRHIVAPHAETGVEQADKLSTHTHGVSSATRAVPRLVPLPRVVGQRFQAGPRTDAGAPGPPTGLASCVASASGRGPINPVPVKCAPGRRQRPRALKPLTRLALDSKTVSPFPYFPRVNVDPGVWKVYPVAYACCLWDAG